MIRLTLATVMLTGAAHAATINASASRGPALPGESTFDVDPADFEGSGRCGYGGSVVGDGCHLVLKDQDSPHLYGRFDPLGGSFADSQDRALVVWHVVSTTAFSV